MEALRAKNRAGFIWLSCSEAGIYPAPIFEFEHFASFGEKII